MSEDNRYMLESLGEYARRAHNESSRQRHLPQAAPDGNAGDRYPV